MLAFYILYYQNIQCLVGGAKTMLKIYKEEAYKNGTGKKLLCILRKTDISAIVPSENNNYSFRIIMNNGGSHFISLGSAYSKGILDMLDAVESDVKEIVFLRDNA